MMKNSGEVCKNRQSASRGKHLLQQSTDKNTVRILEKPLMLHTSLMVLPHSDGVFK
jgi:hypothetical protein